MSTNTSFAALKYAVREGATANPSIDPAAKLILDAPLEGGGNLLIIEAGCGAFMAHFAPRFARVISQNSFHGNHVASLETIALNGYQTVACTLGDIPRATQGLGSPLDGSGKADSLESLSRYPSGAFDAIIFRLSKGTAQVNAVLVEAFRLLKRGGQLLACGHNREGIKSFAKRGEEHFGNMSLLTLKASCRLLRFIKDSDDPIKPIEDPDYFAFRRLELNLPEIGTIAYWSKPGIFSYRATDEGSALLARFIPDCTDKEALDLACGCGVLALAAFRHGAKNILAVDANAIAIQCAKKNFLEAGADADAICTHLTDGITREFDILLVNPPFHQGMETDYSFPDRILEAARRCIKPEGALYLVANQFLDYYSKGRQRFGGVEILARENGYTVYRMTKRN